MIRLNRASQCPTTRLAGSIAALLTLVMSVTAQAATFTWTNVTGNTSVAANWSPATSPNGIGVAGDTLYFNNAISANRTVTLDGLLRAGTLNIGNTTTTNAFTIAATTGGSLIMDAASGSAAINKVLGANANDIISTSLQFDDTLAITNASTVGSLTFSGGMRSASSDISFNGAGAITVSGAAIATGGNLIKNDAGTTTLSVANTYTGTTTINGGTLKLTVAAALPARSAVTVGSGATLDYSVTNTVIGSLAGSGDIVNTGTLAILQIGRNDTSTTFSGRFVPTTAANMAITKIGAGTLTLAPTQASTYTGATTIYGGTFKLDFANTALTSLLAATPVTLSGGSFTMTGKAGLASDQSIGVLGLGVGGGAVTLVAGDAAGTTLRTTGLSASTAGGTLLITAPTNTAFYLSSSFAANSLNNRMVFSDGTANSFNWALNTGANTITTAFTAYNALSVVGGGNNAYAYRLTASQTQTTAAATIRSLKLSSSGKGTQTLDLATFNMTLGSTSLSAPGAILIDGTDGWNINGSTGVLGQGVVAGGDLIFQQYNTTNSVTVNAGIANGVGNLTLVKAGPGALVLAGNNTFAGGVVVAGGNLSFSNVAAAGAGSLGNGSTTAVTICDGATLQYTGATGAISGAAATAGAHTYALQGGNGAISVTNAGTELTLNGAISGVGNLVKEGAGKLSFGAVNTYVGVTTINGGILAINSTGSINSTGRVSIGAGEFKYNSATALTQAVSFTSTGGRLSGTGTISNGITATSGNHIAPGNSVGTLTLGTLTMNTGSIYDFEFKTGSNDQILVSTGGTLTINGGIFNLYNEGTLNQWSSSGNNGNSINGTYNLIGYSGATLVGGTSGLSVGNADSTKKYSFGLANNWVTLSITDNATSTTYTLATTVGASRIMTGQSTSIAAVITNTGSAGADTLGYSGLTATASAGTIGGSGSAGGPLAFAGGSGTNAGLTFTGGATGIQTITPTVTSATNTVLGGTATLSTTGTASVTVVDNRVVTASSVNLGRVMINHLVSGTSALSTTGDNNNYTAVTVNSTLFNSAGSTGSYTLNKTFLSTGTQGGTTTLTTGTEGLAGEVAKDVNVAYTGTAVDNRVVHASSVDLGKLLVGVAASGTSNLTTSGDSDHYTTIKVDGQTFNSAGSTGTHVVSNKSFATSGTSQSSTDAATVLGEGLGGESIQAVNATYTATVFQAASLSGSATAATQTTASNLNLTNAASTDSGGQRAGVTVTGLTVANSATGRSSNFATPSLSGTPAVGTTTNAVSTATVGTVAMQSKRLNGSYSETVTAAAQYTDTTLRSQGTVADQSFTVTASISGNTSTSRTDTYSADILSNQSYNGYGLTSGVSGGKTGPTVATLLGGTASADTTVSMSFSSTLGETGTDLPNRQSDILTLSGINVSDTFVLQMSYDPNAVAGDKYIVYFDTILKRFVNAISHNSDPATADFLNGGQGIGHFELGDYNSSYTLGYYGYNDTTKTAWAVLDHAAAGAEFAVVPEPSTWAMMVGGLGVLGFVQRLRRRSNA